MAFPKIYRPSVGKLSAEKERQQDNIERQQNSQPKLRKNELQKTYNLKELKMVNFKPSETNVKMN